MAACETVVIETENGNVVINKSDYDDEKHTLAGAKPKAKKKDKEIKAEE